MIFASMALLAGLSVASAQQQEDKLADRLLKPNMSLANSAQKKKFDAAGTFIAKRAPSKSFYTRDKSLAKSFPSERTFSSRQFAAHRFKPEDTTANVSPSSQLMKADTIHPVSASYGTRIASEDGRGLRTASFAGNRPFLGSGKSQEALSAQDTPLTIEQVRELLNKNK
jgi:hypothetical protein